MKEYLNKMKNKKISLSPENARKLLVYSNLKNIELSNEIIELAGKNLVNFDKSCFLEFSKKQKNYYQYLTDLKSRSLVFYENFSEFIYPTITYMKENNKLPLVILVQNLQKIKLNMQYINELFPNFRSRWFLLERVSKKFEIPNNIDIIYVQIDKFYKIKNLILEQKIKSVIFILDKPVDESATYAIKNYLDYFSLLQSSMIAVNYTNLLNITGNKEEYYQKINNIFSIFEDSPNKVRYSNSIVTLKNISEIITPVSVNILKIILNESKKTLFEFYGYTEHYASFLYLNSISTQLL